MEKGGRERGKKKGEGGQFYCSVIGGVVPTDSEEEKKRKKERKKRCATPVAMSLLRGAAVP